MSGEVTAAVAELYTEYPYPAHGVISGVIASILKDTVLRLQRELGQRRLRVLDAGCGTGEQTLGIARTFPELDVTGIDLNQASLDFAARLSSKSGISVQLLRRNLMEPLDQEPFDIIVSIGVLHSLEDPLAGFRNLRRSVRHHGAFLGMVYGAFGKWEAFQIRDVLGMICGDEMSRQERLDVLASSKLANNVGIFSHLKDFMRRVQFGPHISASEACRRVLAGRNDAYQADTFTHVQEVVYTWQQVARVLDETGWVFEGWPKKSGMPDVPEQLFKGRALELIKAKPLLERAAIYERLARPPNLYFLASPKAD